MKDARHSMAADVRARKKMMIWEVRPVEKDQKEKYHLTSLMWNLKRNDIKELTYQIQRDSKI